MARKFTVGRSAPARRGFDLATSVRVASKSSATSTYYDNADGSHTQRFAPGPVNYRDAAGQWQPIDTGLRVGPDGRWREKANSLSVSLAAAGDDPSLASLVVNPGSRSAAVQSLAYGLAGAAHVAGHQSGTAVTYAGVLPGTDLRLTATPGGLSGDLVLHSASVETSWVFPLQLQGLTASLAADGSVVLRDSSGKTVGTIPASYAYDSSVDKWSGERATTHAVTYQLVPMPGGVQLRMSLDPQWLRDPARVFPVTVDPTFNAFAVSTYVASNTPPVDHSLEDFLKIGSYDSGTHSASSYVSFPGMGIDNSKVTVSAAQLDLRVNWANGCPTAQRFDVAPVTSGWTPSSLRSYPGPVLGASIGNLTPSTPKACANTAMDPSVGDDVVVPLSVATFNAWAAGTSPDFGLGIYASTTDALHWKFLSSGANPAAQPLLVLTYSGVMLPQIIGQYPPNGTATTTLTPVLSGQGMIDPLVSPPNLGGGPQYEYQVFTSGGVKIADSGLLNGAYQVPAGKLQWGQTYVWEVQAYDGANYTPNPVWYQLSVQVPQPAITSTLAQNQGHGFDGSVGNYTTSATDADVSTVGPALSVVRDYNSRDPRTTGGFGAAWSSIFDAQAVERYDPSGAVLSVVVTYPDGSEVGYGRNADGTFTAPQGRAAKLIRLTTGYELIDKADTTYTFAQSLGSGRYGISSVADANARTVTFTWASGQISTITSGVSGRALHLAWATPSGTGTAHIATVATDPAVTGQAGTALTWTYNYSGDRLTSVCPPGTTTNCTGYGYTTGSPYYTQVMDQSPQSYWPLAEASGNTAASAVLTNEGGDTGTYANVTLANTASPLTGTTTKAPTFNGTSSDVALPDINFGTAMAMSLSMWFKMPAGSHAGVLFSSSDMAIAATATSGNYNPTLYVGTDGKLFGQFWFNNPIGAVNPISTSTSVADGNWHHVVFTGSAATQSMFLDGGLVGSVNGWAAGGSSSAAMPWLLKHSYIGTGFLGGLPWPDNPYTNDASTLHAMYFTGSISHVSFYNTTLTPADVTSQYQAKQRSSSLLATVTRPSGKAYASVSYDPLTSTVTQMTDENGGSWTINPPTVTGSSQVYRASVLGAGPLAYYRLGENAGAAVAPSEVKYTPATYASTTLGGSGPFADQPAAAFNGTSSAVNAPAGVLRSGASSQGLWFSTTKGGGVLSDSQSVPLGSTGSGQPTLWVGADGRLRGLAASGNPTGPFRAALPINKCMDDSAGGTTNGNKVQVWDCQNGNANQDWTLYPDGSVRVFGKCLDLSAYGTTNGTKVQLWDCTGVSNQVWQPYNGGLRNPVSGRCLDDTSGSTTNGNQLQLYDCLGNPNQTWTQALTSSTTVTDGRWHQAALTTDGTTQTLYLDGAVAGSTTGSALTPASASYAYVGAGGTGSGLSGLPANSTVYFTGGIAEVAYYGSALTGAQVAGQWTASQNSGGLYPIKTVTVTDPGGANLTSQYDPLNGNRQIASIDGLGHKTSYGYDASGFMSTVTDPNGDVTTTGHDTDGNQVSQTTCQNQSTSACSTQYMTYSPNTMGADQAKGAAVTASGSVASTAWAPANAVDGNTTSVSGANGWSSNGFTAAANTAWIQVNLGSSRTIDRVDMYPRTDLIGMCFPQAFTIQVSADGTTWTTVTTQTNYPQPTLPAAASFAFTPTNVQYVKVTATTLRKDSNGTYLFQLAELEALNDRPDPTAGQLLTLRDARSSSATDNTYLTSYTYDSVGDLTSVTTPQVAGFPTARKQTLAYTDGTTVAAADTGFAPAGLPYRTTSPSGAVNSVSYLHSGDVASTTDAAGLVTRYGYDNLGRATTKTIVSDTYPNGLTTTFAYDGLNQVTAEVDPPATDRVTGAVHTSHLTTTYDLDGGVVQQQVADDTGGDASRIRSTSYNTHDQVGSVTDAVGNVTSYTYDGYGNKASETDPNHNVTSYTYDPDGHLLTQVLSNYTGDPVNPQPAAPLTEESRAYDPAGRLASITDSMGRSTSYTYYDNGLPATATRTDASGANPYVLKSDSYDLAGNLIKEVTNNGATTTTTGYDAASRPVTSTEDASGVDRTTQTAYTPDDKVAAITRSDSTGSTLTTRALYDPMGRVLAQTVDQGTVAPTGRWKLNDGTGTTAVDSAGNSAGTATSGVTWSGDHGGSAAFTGSGSVIATAGPVVDTTQSFTVAAWVYLTAATGTSVAVSQAGTQVPGFDLRYDSSNHWAMARWSTDTPNPATRYTALSTSTPAINTWTHLVGTFDANTGTMSLYVNGALQGTATDPTPFPARGGLQIGRSMFNGVPGTYWPGEISDVQVYARALSASDVTAVYGGSSPAPGAGVVRTSWQLDRRGLPVSMTDPNGNTTSYGYDEAGHQAVRTAPAVATETNGATPTQVHPVTSTGYNTFGDAVETQDPNGNTTTTIVDAAGRKVSQTLPAYTPPGSSTPTTATAVYIYDGAGNLTRVSDPLRQDTTYTYDQMGDVARVTRPDGGITHTVYDTNGETLVATDATGATTQATYDDLGRTLTSTRLERYPSTSTAVTTNSYTASTTNPGGAWLASSTSPDGVVTRYGYNALGETTAVTDGAGNTTGYRYDFLGRRTAVVAPDATSTTVTYDQSNNPIQTANLDATGAVLTTRAATFDDNGNTRSATDARGNTTTFTYDPLNQLTQETQPATATTPITTSFGYDAAGNRTRFTDGRGNSWIYTYNTWNKPESTLEPATATYTATADRTTTTVYDANARPVTLARPGGVGVTATYDPVGKLLTQSGTGAEAATGTRTFGYDLDGRITSAQTAAADAPATNDTFTYNDRGELLTAAGSAGSSSFSYNPDGLMTSRADDSGTTSYTYDNADRLQTLADAASGSTLAYAYNKLSQVATVQYGSAADKRTLGYDSLHRLTSDQLTTAAGAAIGSITYGYDSNNNLTAKTTAGFGANNPTTANTYTYDFANRLTSWTNGTTTVGYAYDASGNRIQVGSNVYTYDARDQLTSDGANTYTYTARGTLSGQATTGGTTTATTADAFDQVTTDAAQNYTYDALGRLLHTGGGNVHTLTYSGMDNNVANDTTATYSRDPAGTVTGVASGGAGRIVWTDQHTDVVAMFTESGTGFAGSTSYDPLGNRLTTSGTMSGNLGYQSEWTDATTGKVNMAARWYNPAVGQFQSKDTAAQNPVPNSANANPFAYVEDNPLTGTDPTGHWSLGGLWHAGASWVSNHVWHPIYNHVVHPIIHAVESGWDWVKQQAHNFAVEMQRLQDAFNREMAQFRREMQQIENTFKAVNNQIRQWRAEAAHVVTTAWHKTTEAVTTGVVFLKHHAATIGAFVVSTAVFMGCEAVLGAATGGVGAVAGAVACGALSGAVGGLVSQGAKCFDGQKGACSAGSFLKAGVVGGVVGGLSGLGGALGGKLLSAVGGKALSAVGGLFGRGGAEAGEAAAEGGLSEAATSTADTAAESGAEDAANTSAGGAARGAGEKPAAERPSSGRSEAGRESESSPCPAGVPHSFTGATPILMADGTAKHIDQIKVGDHIQNSVPGQTGTQTHTVDKVIVTTTDHDFVDVTVAPGPTTVQRGKARRAAVAAAVALTAALAGPAAATGLTAQAGTLTTTNHHPFYDITQAAFVEAANLHVGDQLQSPHGGVSVTNLRLYHTTQTTYDLTINGLHTYYAVAGNVPILVHNCGGYDLRGKDPVSVVPDNASVRELTPDPNGGAQYGLEFKWTNENNQTVRLRIHGPDGTAPPGSNAASGDTFRLQIGGRYQDIEGNLYPRNVHNPNSPHYDPAAANVTHIPWPSEYPGL
ncbi:MAG TPA: LamG-like jellyroll fold domain-containing protein [Rugosimonospora sp.]|nr:LamG-like jellyroll fold domain-containing protein [Rugosimonospora sp.]